MHTNNTYTLMCTYTPIHAHIYTYKYIDKNVLFKISNKFIRLLLLIRKRRRKKWRRARARKRKTRKMRRK